MRVVIIGAGNVATVFGRIMTRRNHQVIQVVSRNELHAAALASELDCGFATDPAGLDITADIYIVAISDDALNEIHKTYVLGDKLVVHTAGSVSKQVLQAVSTRYGVLYPLQSLRKEKMELQQDIPLLVDGNTEATTELLEQFALSLSAIVARVKDTDRLKLHVAAVFVSNFTNQFYTLAAGYCESERLDFKMLQPLIEETALRLRYQAPAEMQTGPAIRADTATIRKHLHLLTGHPYLKKMYRQMTNSIMGMPVIRQAELPK